MVGCRVALMGGSGPPSPKNTFCKGGPRGGLLKSVKSLIVNVWTFKQSFLSWEV